MSFPRTELMSHGASALSSLRVCELLQIGTSVLVLLLLLLLEEAVGFHRTHPLLLHDPLPGHGGTGRGGRSRVAQQGVEQQVPLSCLPVGGDTHIFKMEECCWKDV